LQHRLVVFGIVSSIMIKSASTKTLCGRWKNHCQAVWESATFLEVSEAKGTQDQWWWAQTAMVEHN
jgi:hypothetical protein